MLIRQPEGTTKSYIIHISLYDRDVAVCGDKYDLPLFDIDTEHWPSGTCQASTFMNHETGCTVIAFADYSKPPQPGLIAHECLHVVNFIMDKVGFKPDRMNDEPDAYLLQYIVACVHEVYSMIQEQHNVSGNKVKRK